MTYAQIIATAGRAADDECRLYNGRRIAFVERVWELLPTSGFGRSVAAQTLLARSEFADIGVRNITRITRLTGYAQTHRALEYLPPLLARFVAYQAASNRALQYS